MASKKLTISLDEKVLSGIDEYAESLGVSRSAAITFLVNQGFMVVNSANQLKQLTEALEKAEQLGKE